MRSTNVYAIGNMRSSIKGAQRSLNMYIASRAGQTSNSWVFIVGHSPVCCVRPPSLMAAASVKTVHSFLFALLFPAFYFSP